MSLDGDEAAFAGVTRRLGGRLLAHRPLTGGVSARVERLDIEHDDGRVRAVVFRQPKAAEWKTAAGEDGTRREYDLLGALHARGIPVPRPLLLDLSQEVFARSYFVMEHLDGSPELVDVPDALLRMADLLARVHGIDPGSVPELPAREDPVAGLLEFLPAEHEALRAVLKHEPPRLAPRRSVLHGDYWPGNLLWRGRELVALIDWEDAAIGDPLSDVACCRLELRYKHGADAAERFTGLYATCSGSDVRELPVWDAYVAAAALAFMGQWGLPATREAHMRNEARVSLQTAATELVGRASSRNPAPY